MSDPTSDFGRLDHRVPLPQPSVNRVGPGWSDPAMRVQRADARTHGPLSVLAPGELLPAAEPPPPPPPPILSEAERREVLRKAISARDAAKVALDEATARHERALADESRCREALAAYAALPAEVARAKEFAHRNGTDPGLPETLRARLQSRTLAEADLQAAIASVEVFAKELQAASEVHKAAAGWQLAKALRAVIDVGRDLLRPELEAAEQRAAALRQVIKRSRPWASVAEALMLDPLHAPLTIDVPDVPEPDVPEPDVPQRPLVPPLPPDEIKVMKPGGGFELMTEAELAARAKAERASPMSAAMREFDAVERARRCLTPGRTRCRTRRRQRDPICRHRTQTCRDRRRGPMPRASIRTCRLTGRRGTSTRCAGDRNSDAGPRRRAGVP